MCADKVRQGAVWFGGVEETALRVLLADDDPLLRKVTKLALERLGVACEAVENGAEAVTRWREIRHELVLLDVEMPELRGPDVARLIRAEPDGDRPYLIALTGHQGGPELDEALAAGIDRAVRKPVRGAQLGELLSEARGRSQPAPSGTASSAAPTLDRTALERLAELSGDPTIIHDLIDMFLADAPARMAAIDGATSADAMARAAHAFKSGSGTLGALAVHEACQALEAAGRAGDLSQRAVLVGTLRERLDDLVRELRTWRGS